MDPSVIICCSIITEPSKLSSAIQSIAPSPNVQVITVFGGYVKGRVNLLGIVVSLSNFPLSENLPSLPHVWVSIVSNTNVGGTGVFVASFISPLLIASSVNAGLRAVSSSNGIPATSSELLSLKEVYVIDSFNPLFSHLKLADSVFPSPTVTLFSSLHSISFVSSSIPSVLIKLNNNLTEYGVFKVWVIKANKLNDIVPGTKVNPLICLKVINISSLFSASSNFGSSEICSSSSILLDLFVSAGSVESSPPLSELPESTPVDSTVFPGSPFVVIRSSVKNPGMTNASIPLIVTTVCSKAIGWLFISPNILTSKLKTFPSMLIIVNPNLIPLKNNTNVWSGLISVGKLSTVNLNVNVPSLTESKLKEFISTVANDGIGMLDLSFKAPLFIPSSVNLGFNKVSSNGRPATPSQEAISIDTRSSVLGKVHVKLAGAIGEPLRVTSLSILHVASTGSLLLPAPVM